jgi:hypothetical protein
VSNICLYLDEDVMERSLVLSLRSRGVDVITVSDASKAGQSDEEQLSWATEQGRVLYSSNIGDFYRLHTDLLTEKRFHAGIILVPQQRYSVGEQLRGLLNLIATKSAKEMQNQLEFLSTYLRDE